MFFDVEFVVWSVVSIYNQLALLPESETGKKGNEVEKEPLRPFDP